MADERTRQPTSLGSFLAGERHRILDGASPERRAQLAQAEQSRAVYRAWNAVCAGTREGAHVTGLRYLPDTNELLVYLDAPTWTQEMTMLREIIRARMELQGVKLAGFKFRTSKAGYSSAARAHAAAGAGTSATAAPTAPAAAPSPRPARRAPHARRGRRARRRRGAHRQPRPRLRPQKRDESERRVEKGPRCAKRGVNAIWWPCRTV